MFRTLSAALAAALLALPAAAHDGVHVSDAYARISPHAGAVFLVIENHSDQDDRLIAAASDVAERVELHTHRQDANGVMQMMQDEDGFPVPAGMSHELARGGDHIMLMGLTRELEDGDTFTVTLTFERGEVVPVEVVVDNARRPAAGMQGMGMGGGQGGHVMHGAASP